MLAFALALFGFSALQAAPSLSPAERAWVQAHPVVHIQMCRDCPPFEYREKGQDQGLAHDLLVEAARQVSLTVVVDETGWTEALESFRAGHPKVDLLLAISNSPERAGFVGFTRPYVTFPQVIFTTKDHAFVSGLADLHNERVAVEHDYLMEGWLLRDLPAGHVKVVNSTDEALLALSRGQVGAYIGNLATASHLIDRKGLANLKVAAPSPYEDESFSLGVRKDAPLLLSALQKGLDAITPGQQQAIRQRYLSVRYEFGLRPLDILKWLLGFGLVAALFIFELRRLVKSRTRELTAEAERRANAEERIRRSEKVEALGTLAAGIAHDFNNILAGIRGHLDLVRLQVKGADAGVDGDLRAIDKGVGRAAELVRQIQSFSRQMPQAVQSVAMTAAAEEALTLLRASLPVSIEIRSDLKGQGRVLAAPGDLHRIIVNLCVNAANAMRGKPGLLQLEVADEALVRSPYHAEPPLAPGAYVRLSVIDNGHGMSPEVQARIFDPFFTTSSDAKGTGLGLAVVHGLARACGASIGVQSQPGHGTRFDLYYPMVQAEEPAAPAPKAPSAAQGRRILFVDDEPAVTASSVRLLEQMGQRVAGFTDPQRAWRYFEADPTAFDVVVLDSSMPGLDGAALAARIRGLAPRLPILLCSGYHEGPRDPALFDAIFEKPASMADLMAAISRLT